jgi:DNA-binding NarL/FixJ family response regulator
VAIAGRRHIEQDLSRRIRVMIVDGHTRVRQSLRVFLSTYAEMDVVAACGGGFEALRSFMECRPDVVIMDLFMPGMDGSVLTSMMTQVDPTCRVITLTSFFDPEMSRCALEAGAVCCLVKDGSTGALVQAIRDACQDAGDGHMTFIQAKTGLNTEPKTGTPSDGGARRSAYDDCIHECDEQHGHSLENRGKETTRK